MAQRTAEYLKMEDQIPEETWRHWGTAQQSEGVFIPRTWRVHQVLRK